MTVPTVSNEEPTALGRRSGGEASSGHGRFTNLVRLGQVDSTNRFALDRAAEGAPEGLVVVAEEQTAGRGRLGRRWVAPPGTAFLCSVLLRPGPRSGPDAGFLATSCVALATREAAFETAGVTCDLKWPNDLLVGPRKLAGVLAEVAADGALVVGVGCNLTGRPGPVAGAGAGGGAWPPPGATTLEDEADGRLVGRDRFLEAFLAGLDRRYGPVLADGVVEARRRLVDEHRAALATIGRTVRVELPDARVLVGRASRLLDDGRLVVETAPRPGYPPGQVVVEAGDVVHLRGQG